MNDSSGAALRDLAQQQLDQPRRLRARRPGAALAHLVLPYRQQARALVGLQRAV